MRIYLGADHAGFALKERVKLFLKTRHSVIDLGNKIYDATDDYPVVASRVGKAVARQNARGILFCGSAEGICIAANKIKGVRAVAPATETAAKLSREHNDANVLCLPGGKTLRKTPGLGLSEKKARKLVAVWLKTRFSGVSRYKRRILQIRMLEK